jgi:hypothetical protein
VLNAYLAATQSLLQNPGAPSTLYSTANLTTWINTARGQVAGEAEAIRAMGTIQTVVGQRAYNFDQISFGVAATTGIQGAINVQQINFSVGTGQKQVYAREWPWFFTYYLNNPVPSSGQPRHWSQFSQGAADPGVGGGAGTKGTGSFYVDPIPDAVYTLNCDCSAYPIALVDDSTVEALSYFWTDAVSFLSAYYALMSSQTSEREAQAARMYSEHYRQFMANARRNSNPSVLRYMYSQAQDVAQTNKMGLQPRGEQQ